MAQSPCSFDQLRYRGPARHMYPAIVAGRDSERAHLRLCRDHFFELYDYLATYFETVDYSKPASSQRRYDVCAIDGAGLAGEVAVFVTSYPESDTQVDFYAKVGSCCVDKLAKRLLLR